MGLSCLISFLVSTQLALVTPDLAKPPTLDRHPTLVRMLEENNRQRASVGLPAQKMSLELTRAAQDHAWYMARTGNFSHYANGGPVARAHRYGYDGPLSENIALGYETISGVFQGWRQSSGHWANITGRDARAGFGFAISADGTCYWVGMYGD